MTAAVIYLAAVLLANLTATLFIPLEALEGWGIYVSVGTLVFGITFTQRDLMHRRGRPFVYRIIALSAFLTLLLLLSVKFVWGGAAAEGLARMGWDWPAEALIMLASSGWRIFLASILAILISETADTEVFHRLKDRNWLVRVFRSNAVSIPVDSAVFNLIAFAGSPFFSAPVLLKVILGEIVSKFVVGAVYAYFRRPRS